MNGTFDPLYRRYVVELDHDERRTIASHTRLRRSLRRHRLDR